MTHRMFNDSLLDTAPQTDRDVRYPDWGNEPKKAVVSSVGVGVPSQSKMTSSHLGQIDESLQRFLSNNGLDYEVYPGNFLIVRVMRAIHFESGSARVSRESRPWLSSIRRYLEKEASNDLEVVVDGHTDDIGNTKNNERLSKKEQKR
ncbi:OmpA family protein [Vibrio sp. PP-XX7]